MMRQGGNGQIRDFFKKMKIENSPLTTLYSTNAATHYRKKLKELVDSGMSSSTSRRTPITFPKETTEPSPQSSTSKTAAPPSPPPEKVVAELYEVTFGEGPMGLTLTQDFKGGAIVSRLVPGGTAERHSVHTGDHVVGVVGKSITEYDEVMHMILCMSRPLRLTFARMKSVTVAPAQTAATSTSPPSSVSTVSTSAAGKKPAGGGTSGAAALGGGSAKHSSSTLTPLKALLEAEEFTHRKLAQKPSSIVHKVPVKVEKETVEDHEHMSQTKMIPKKLKKSKRIPKTASGESIATESSGASFRGSVSNSSLESCGSVVEGEKVGQPQIDGLPGVDAPATVTDKRKSDQELDAPGHLSNNDAQNAAKEITEDAAPTGTDSPNENLESLSRAVDCVTASEEGEVPVNGPDDDASLDEINDRVGHEGIYAGEICEDDEYASSDAEAEGDDESDESEDDEEDDNESENSVEEGAATPEGNKAAASQPDTTKASDVKDEGDNCRGEDGEGGDDDEPVALFIKVSRPGDRFYFIYYNAYFPVAIFFIVP
jgi:hypothetical protein